MSNPQFAAHIAFLPIPGLLWVWSTQVDQRSDSELANGFLKVFRIELGAAIKSARFHHIQVVGEQTPPLLDAKQEQRATDNHH